MNGFVYVGAKVSIFYQPVPISTGFLDLKNLFSIARSFTARQILHVTEKNANFGASNHSNPKQYMKKTLIILYASLMALTVAAQGLPQFGSDNFDGWTYNNPGIALTSSNISAGRIVLYVNSKGKALMLTSPEFNCQGMDSIAASVLWQTTTFQSSGFDLSRTALTMVIDDSQGQPLDSVTCVPTVTGSYHTLSLRLAVPRDLTACRLRFVSWSGDVVSSGAFRKADITAVTATVPPDDVLLGDLDNDGIVNIGDVTELIDYLIIGVPDNILYVADIDHDGTVSIADITALIDLIIRGNANP